jgi:hypothetical protein
MACVRFEAVAASGDTTKMALSAYINVYISVMSNRLCYRFRIGHVYSERNMRMFDFLDNMTMYKICSMDDTMTEACAKTLTVDMTACYASLRARGGDAQRAWLVHFYKIVMSAKTK